MNTFKAGDIVVGTKLASERYAVTVEGWTGKVIATYVNTMKLTNADGTFRPVVRTDCFRLATEEEKRKAGFSMTKFKVGDRIIGNSHAGVYGITTTGWIGTVLEVDTDCEDGDDIRVTGPGISKLGVHVLSSRFDLYKPYKDNSLAIKDVIFNAPATIVFWSDDTKTIVKCGEGEKYDPEKGLALCIAKKALGNKHDYYEPFKKYLGKYHKKESKKASAKKPVAPTTKTKKPAPKSTAKKTTGRKTKK